jgi:hypothetical protein
VAGALLLLKRQAKPENARGLDVPGILVVIAGLVALIYGLSSAESNGWGSATTLTCIGLGAALLAVFAVIEERVEDRSSVAPAYHLGPDPRRLVPDPGNHRHRHVRRLPVPDLLTSL